MNSALFTAVLLLGLGVNSAFATDIQATFEGSHGAYLGILVEDVKNARNELALGLSEELGCKKVRLCLTQAKTTGILSRGKFQLSLTASCSAQFSNFRFHLFPAFDWSERSVVKFGFLPRGESTLVYYSRELDALPDGRYDDTINRLPICF